MNVMSLMKRLKGEVLANRARVKVDGKTVIIGRLQGQEWVATEAGEKLEKDLNAKKAEKEPEPEKESTAKSTKES